MSARAWKRRRLRRHVERMPPEAAAKLVFGHTAKIEARMAKIDARMQANLMWFSKQQIAWVEDK